MTELAPCPFCGSPAQLIPAVYDTNDPWIECTNPDCEVSQNSGNYATEDAAIAAWNRRATPADVSGLVERLCKLHETLLARTQEHVAVVDEADLWAWAELVLSAATAIDRGSRSQPSPARGVEAVAWRCFHCDDVFTDEAAARDHFGPEQDSVPACQIKAGAEGSLVKALRQAETAATEAIRMMHGESTEGYRLWRRDASRHDAALQAAEELGYERGLRAALEPAPARADAGTAATHRHKRRGTEYVLIGFGKMQATEWRERGWNDVWQTDTFSQPVDMREVAIYRSVEDGSLWVRPREEFEDGRFEPINPDTGRGK